MPEDARNVLDKFKGMSEDDIREVLDKNGIEVEVAIENTLRDFNMGSIVRSANAFGIRKIHVVGRRQWNKRGAMMTDKYLNIEYHPDFSALRRYADQTKRPIVAIDNVSGAIPLSVAPKDSRAVLLFGQEGPGLSDDALAKANATVEIEQRGSTRSINVGVAAGIVIYEWVQSLTN